ncbi:MAG: hypothetical protein HY355_06745 [Armatimonadetes bacterium]|nr:hypothetical protein [Armatimonadota bacterium]
MLLDTFLPDYHFREVHAMRVRASPSRLFRAVRDVTPADVPLASALLWVRALPARLAGRGRPGLARRRPIIEQALRGGFVLLAEEPDRELVLGTIGQFWKVLGTEPPSVTTPAEFLAFDRPDYARAAINFSVEESCGGSTIIRTETRVAVADPVARRKFAAYWPVIYPGSALIRRMWLGAIKRRAERATPGSGEEVQ